MLRSTGLFIASDTIAARIMRGENVTPDDYYLRTSILFETASTRLRLLNRALHVGVGQRTAIGVITDVFAIL